MIDRIYIPTHGRAGKIATLSMLRYCSCDIPVTLLIDERESHAAYADEVEKYGVEVVQFDRRKLVFDTMEPTASPLRNAVVYGRIYADIQARRDGCAYYAVFDDDYNSVQYSGFFEPGTRTDKCALERFFCDACLILSVDSRIATVAAAQGGDFISAKEFRSYRGLVKRKAMNSFVLSTDRDPPSWYGVVNEDVNAYILAALEGRICVTLAIYQIEQGVTQAREGGMSDLYHAMGTAWKSWPSTALYPAAVTYSIVQGSHHQHPRIHHRIDWAHLAPKIVSSRYRKIK